MVDVGLANPLVEASAGSGGKLPPMVYHFHESPILGFGEDEAFFFDDFFTFAQRLTAAFLAAAERSSGVIWAYRLATISEPIDRFFAMDRL